MSQSVSHRNPAFLSQSQEPCFPDRRKGARKILVRIVCVLPTIGSGLMRRLCLETRFVIHFIHLCVIMDDLGECNCHAHGVLRSWGVLTVGSYIFLPNYLLSVRY
jgi:hypothetical protein